MSSFIIMAEAAERLAGFWNLKIYLINLDIAGSRSVRVEQRDPFWTLTSTLYALEQDAANDPKPENEGFPINTNNNIDRYFEKYKVEAGGKINWIFHNRASIKDKYNERLSESCCWVHAEMKIMAYVMSLQDPQVEYEKQPMGSSRYACGSCYQMLISGYKVSG